MSDTEKETDERGMPVVALLLVVGLFTAAIVGIDAWRQVELEKAKARTPVAEKAEEIKKQSPEK